jgi:Trypsin-like peptidase domain
MRRQHTPRARPRACGRILAAGLLTVLAVTRLAAPAAAAPPHSPEERAAAIASPALVFLDIGLEGYLRNRSTGALVDDAPAVVHSQCSGFVVSEDGDVVTTTQCLQSRQDSLRGAAAFIVANNMIKAGKLASGKKTVFVDEIKRTADFTGKAKGTAPTVSTVTGQVIHATTDPDKATTISGRVVDAQPIESGDVALVKLDTKGLPVAKLAPTTLNPNTQIVMLGFTTPNPDADPANYAVQSRSGKIVSPYGTQSPRRYLLDGDLGVASRGGMVVDGNGNVVAMITADVTTTQRANNIGVDGARVADLLGKAGVSNELTSTDQAYRTGLDAYFGGRYTDAIKQFDTVIAAQPNNLPAQTYRAHATQRLAIEGDPTSSTDTWSLVFVAAAVVLAIVMVLVMLLRGRRLRKRERAMDQYEPYAGGPPISGGPTSGVPTSGLPTSSAPPLASPGWGVPSSPATGSPWEVPIIPGGMDYSTSVALPVAPPGPGVAPEPGAPNGQPLVPTLDQWAPPVTPPVPTLDQWAPPVPTLDQWAPPVTPPPAPPVAAPPAPLTPEERLAAWPAVIIWRDSNADDPVPPPSPAPNLATDPSTLPPSYPPSDRPT